MKHPKRVRAEIELVSSHFGPVEFDDNYILIEKFNLPRGFNKKYSKLLCVLPNDYPEYPIKAMYLEKHLKKNEKKLDHYYENNYGDKKIRNQGWAWISIHFTSWSPNANSIIRGNNLLTAIEALYDALKYD